MHQVGAARPFRHRPALEADSFGHASIDFLWGSGFIPDELSEPWATIAGQVMLLVQERMQLVPRSSFIRVHGDCHVGNVLWRDATPWFVDFDDSRMAPRMQDLWMLLSGDRDRRQQQLAHLLKGYRQFSDFFAVELEIIEALRTLRMLHHSAWIARRWDDPAFPPAFPWFGTQRYWEEQILELKEQFAALQEPPLELEPF